MNARRILLYCDDIKLLHMTNWMHCYNLIVRYAEIGCTLSRLCVLLPKLDGKRCRRPILRRIAAAECLRVRLCRKTDEGPGGKPCRTAVGAGNVGCAAGQLSAGEVGCAAR